MVTADVLVIGAGFSGIAAARTLHRRGISFRVLEANDRLGGRVYTRAYAEGFYLDLGGQWIGPTQDRMYQLVAEYQLEIFRTHDAGKHVLDLNGKLSAYRGLIPRVDPLSLLNLAWILERLERMAKGVDRQNPHMHPQAASWDRQTLAEFVRRNCPLPKARTIVTICLETIFAASLDRVSLLHALFYIRSGTSLNGLLRINRGAQQDRVKGGMQPLVERMADDFRANIHLQCPVTEIQLQADGVRVLTATGETFQARRAICAVPPAVLTKITCTPGWSPQRTALLAQLPMGSIAKCFAIYPRPFWREAGQSGQAVADAQSPFQTVFDASPADGSRGILLGFCIANRYDSFFALPQEIRRQRALAAFARYFGERARQVEVYEDYSMKESAWSDGCYAALYPPHVRSRVGNLLAEPEGAVHFAGTETADRWFGYIEGAVRAGERAAEEARRALLT